MINGNMYYIVFIAIIQKQTIINTFFKKLGNEKLGKYEPLKCNILQITKVHRHSTKFEDQA